MAFGNLGFDICMFSFGDQSVVNCCDKRGAQKQMTKDFHEEYFCAVLRRGQVLHTPQLKFNSLDSILSST
jgi:hypothetical protein